MIDLLVWILIFTISLIVLIKSSDKFTESAEKIGLYFGLPSFIVGVTIVAIGTSLPELISSIFAVFRDSSEIVVGNVIGSNIANIFLILGLAAIIGKRLKIGFELTHVDIPLLFGSAFLFTIMIWDGIFTLPEALISIAGLITYSLYTISPETKHTEFKKVKKIEKIIKKKLPFNTWLMLIISTIFIYIGAKYTIEAVISLSSILGIGKDIIAISVVAIGTSLPELAVSIAAIKKGRHSIAIGNVLGSNIFNTFGVMGISALFGTLIIPENVIMRGLPTMIIATFMFAFITHEKYITKYEGYTLILFYGLFIGKLFGVF